VSVDIDRDDDDVVLRLRTDGCLLPPAERDVLAGDLRIDRVRHAQGLGVWDVYRCVWYSGGEIRVDGDGDIHLPPARRGP
jgi:hypothetical protein